MTLETFFEKFDRFAEAPGAVPKMRELILQLAAHGRLVEQSADDAPASTLLPQIEQNFRLLRAARKVRGEPVESLKTQELPDIPATWAWVPLGNVADYGSSDKVESSGISEDAWLLDLEDIEKDTSRLLRRKAYRDDPSRSTKAVFIAGDVLYGKLRPYLNKVLVADAPGYCTTEIIPIRTFGFIEPMYLCYALKRPEFVAYANAKSYGMNLPRLGTDDARRAPFPLPPLAEQKRIVAKVDELMALCDRLEEQQQEREKKHAVLAPAALARFADAPTTTNVDLLFHDSYFIEPAHLRRAILSLAVRGKLVPQDQRNEPASEILASGVDLPGGHVRRRKVVKQAPITSQLDTLPSLPASWEYATVQMLYDLNLIVDYADGNHGALYPRSAEFGESGVRFVTARDIVNGRVSWASCVRLNEDRAQELTKGWAQGGDVLLTHNATVGRVARVEPEVGRFILGTSVTFYRLNEEFIDAGYFYYVLCSPTWQGQLEAIMEQTTRNQVSIQKQAFFQVPIPPVREQRRIAAKADQLMTMVNRLEVQLAASRAAAVNLLDAVVAELSARG